MDGGSYPAALLLRTPRGGRRFPDFQDFRADGRRFGIIGHSALQLWLSISRQLQWRFIRRSF